MLTPNIILIAAGVLVVFLIVMIVWLSKDLARGRKAKKAAKANPAPAVPVPVKSWLLTTREAQEGDTIVFRCNYVVTQGSTTRDICPFEVIYTIKAPASVDIEVPEPVLAHLGKHARPA